ncbi:Uncharacterized protein FWK35_00018051 [Aphis craccivora]|uniref:Uncharacterized protein n=1 Tax=Aphis craccivora TaxID=307492 RepID=A0A6G0YHF4_APHCR|nr:Uncharacterized protein FWK35_00018051 [Aphis craccivora]
MLYDKKKFVCHHSAFQKPSRDDNKKGLSKNADCPASTICFPMLIAHIILFGNLLTYYSKSEFRFLLSLLYIQLD